MKIVAQHYKSGELALLDVPAPACRPGGVLVRTEFSLISTGTEMMKVAESKLSLIGKARARPDQVQNVMRSVAQQGVLATYRKVVNRLDSLTPLGYSCVGVVEQVGAGVDGFEVGQRVACGGNQFALHAEFNWVPVNLCVRVPDTVRPEHAAFTTVGAIAMQGFRQSEATLGETACVVGLGLIGQLLLQILTAAGVRVVGVDINESRCELARRLGAEAAAAPASAAFDALVDRLARMTNGAGCDHVFLTAGGDRNDPVKIAAALARDRARVVDIGKTRLDLPWKDYYEKELDVRFSRSYGPGRYDPVYEERGVDYPIGYVRWTEHRNMACFVDLLHQRRIDLDPLTSEVFPFADAVSVYERINGGAVRGLGILFRYDAAATAERLVSGAPTAAPQRAAPRAVRGRRVRIGAIGAGNYASSMLLPHLARDPRVELVEVATQSSLSAANAAKKHGFARMSTDAARMLDDASVDAVLVLTRHSSHAQLTCEALRAGKAVFVEKPLAIDAEQLAAIADVIAETRNDRLMVGLNRRFSPLLLDLKRGWGERAGPHVVQYRVNAGRLDNKSWYADAGTEGSRFVGEGCHFIDTISWWLDADPIEVSAVHAEDDSDNMVATLRYADGSV
ncbi:MAG TPA: bi-domain-containing oxidoreductase, partial [Gemmatirosa sp.]